MKNFSRKHLAIILAAVLVLGIGLAVLPGYTTELAPSPSPTPSAAPSDPAEWQENLAYLAGDRVEWQGDLFLAVRENQGESPASSSAWEKISPDSSSSAMTSSSSSSVAFASVSPSPTASPVSQSTSSVTSERPSASSAASSSSSTTISSKPSASSTVVPVSAGKKCVAYYPSWKPGSTDKLRWDCLTHVIYAFAIPTAEGEIMPLSGQETARKIIREAHQNGVKVLLAVGGWSYNNIPLESVFVEATETAEKRESLTQSLLDLCTSFGFDGIDMDWEYPRAGQPSQTQYESLMLLLSKRLHAQGKLLTTAVIGGVDQQGHPYYDTAAHTAAVIRAVDWINVMAYDANETEHSSYDFMTACYSHWRNTMGVPAGKIVLGIPFYGRPGGISYDTLIQYNPDARLRDSIAYNGVTVFYNGEATVRKKAEFAARNAAGVMIWEASQDSSTYPLLRILGQILR